MDGKVAPPDGRVAEIAERQHGVVSVGQLRACGIGDDAIRSRVIAGRLHRVHRGVYAVGHRALSPPGRWLAGVLAVGGGPRGGGSILDRWGAAVSHRSAASLWDLLPVVDAPCDVIVAGRGGKARRMGVNIHRPRSLAGAEVTLHRGIPVTTPRRTLEDLRRVVAYGRPGAVSPRELRRARRQASVLGLPIGDEDADRTRGDLEGMFLRLCARHRLPRPEVNVRVGSFLIDFLWRDARLAVETDHYVHHRGREAFQEDRGRDLELRRRGFEVVRLSEKQLEAEAGRVAEVLRGALRRRGAG